MKIINIKNKMKIYNLNDLRYKKIAILGYGAEGKSTLRFLQKNKVEDITIIDKKEIEEKNEDVKYIYGENYLDNLDTYDIIIKSPGISPYQNNLLRYKEKITSQTQLFTDIYNGKIIGITGTKGKSTISTILYLSLQNAGYKTKLVGNIGTPVLDEIDLKSNEKYDYIIYEMSSYMLEGVSPNLYIGYINNIYNCHLDWHNGIDNYSKAKLNIIENSKHKVANIEIEKYIKNIDDIVYFGEGANFVYKENFFFEYNKKILEDKNIKLKGIHNRNNILGIITILYRIKKDKFCSNWIGNRLINGLKIALEGFSGLEHRLEEVGIYKDILFINDAIATTPESTIAAIKTYEHNIGTILLGGYDYGFSFEELRQILIKSDIKNIVLFPESGEKILGDLSDYNYEEEFKITIDGKEINILKTRSMEKAVIFGYKYTQRGKICLLSNASASYGLWSGYIEKGNQFKEFIKKHSI